MSLVTIICMSYICLTFPKHENPLFFFHYRVGHGADIEFHIKGWGGGGPRFRDNGTWSSCHKNLFSTPWCLDKNFMLEIVDVIALERFRIVTHSNAASFSRKATLCETTFSTAENTKLDTKMTTDSERSSKIKVTLRWVVFEILLMSAVICV